MTRRSLLLSTLSAATVADIATARQHAYSAASAKATYRYLSIAYASEIEALVPPKQPLALQKRATSDMDELFPSPASILRHVISPDLRICNVL